MSGAFQEGDYCPSTPMQSAFSFLGDYLGEVAARECSGGSYPGVESGVRDQKVTSVP